MALTAIRHLRTDPNAQQCLTAMSSIDSLQPLIQLAEELGFEITAAELQQAFVLEWQMRRMKQHASATNSD